jgi:BASS family bile acid:Na+ symporter
MSGMGLGLNLDAFKQVLQKPQALVCGLIAQLMMLPLIGFGVAALFSLAPELVVGIVILAVCPGGPTSNMLTDLFGFWGDKYLKTPLNWGLQVDTLTKKTNLNDS